MNRLLSRLCCITRGRSQSTDQVEQLSPSKPHGSKQCEDSCSSSERSKVQIQILTPDASLRDFGAFGFGFERDFHQKYVLTYKVLGRGSFGIVFEGKTKSTGEPVAVKTLDKSFFTQASDRRDLRTEVDVLTRIGNGSLNCITLLGAFEDNSRIYLVLEKASGGTLWDRLKRRGHFSEADAMPVARAVLQMIAQCHAKNIIYRDVKLENFVYINSAKDSALKAIDFGLAVHHPTGLPNLRETSGSPNFMAPEVILQNYSFPCDVWSAGVLLYMLLSGTRPFVGDHELRGDKWTASLFKDILKKPVRLNTPAWTHVSAKAKSLVSQLLEKDPKKRITVEAALWHPWLDCGSVKGLAFPEFNQTIVARLQRFSTYDTFKKKSMALIMRGHKKQQPDDALARTLSEHFESKSKSFLSNHSNTSEIFTQYLEDGLEASKLSTLFKNMDKDAKGVICFEDAKSGLFEAGFSVSDAELTKIWTSICDENSTGEVDICDFMTALMDWDNLELVVQSSGGSMKDIYKGVFDFFDVSEKGYLEVSDLARVLNKTKGHPEIKNLMTIMDTSKTGKITFESFEEAMIGNKSDKLNIYDLRLRKEKSRSAPSIAYKLT